MRYRVLVAFLFSGLLLGAWSCAKWKDPAPTTDPRLTNPYCNDPNAVNYNWGFPGKPDNSVCFYPTDLFAGRYLFVDSIYLSSDLTYLGTLTETLFVSKVSQTKLSITGFCSSGNTLTFTADKTYTATLDTLVGDSITARGQIMCRAKDTVNGAITKDRIVDSLLHVSFQVVSDTNVTTHTGSAKQF